MRKSCGSSSSRADGKTFASNNARSVYLVVLENCCRKNSMGPSSMRRFSMRRSSMRRSILLVSLVSVISASVFTHSTFAQAQTTKPKLTLDEFFNSVSFPSVKVSPDGTSVVIETERADWDQQIFRKELWLYQTASGSLTQLTQSGHDSSPQWSPDGQWIAFLSERKVVAAKDADAGDSKEDEKDKDKDKDKDVAQLFLISPVGGE